MDEAVSNTDVKSMNEKAILIPIFFKRITNLKIAAVWRKQIFFLEN